MVAGDHLDADAGCLTLGHGPDGFVPGRIDDARQGHQGEAAGHMLEIQPVAALGHGNQGQGQNPLAFPGHLVNLFFPPGLLDGGAFPLFLLPGTSAQHRLRA